MFVGAALLLAGAALSFAETTPTLSVELPHDSPVLLQAVTISPIVARNRSAAAPDSKVFNAQLRNIAQKEIIAVTFDLSTGAGDGAVHGTIALPALRALPGNAISLRFHWRDQPIPGARSAAADGVVRLSLDCVLFSDLSSYGPNRLGSLRMLFVNALENRREREHLSALLQQNRLPEIRHSLNFGLPQTPSTLQFSLLGRVTAAPTAQRTQVAVINFASAPVEASHAEAQLTASKVAYPSVLLLNRSQKTIKAVQLSFVVRDEHGDERLLAALPAEQSIPPHQTVRLGSAMASALSRESGTPVVVRAVIAFVRAVEFADGTVFIPSYADVVNATGDQMLQSAIEDSPERQRLSALFRRAGMSGVEADLKTN